MLLASCLLPAACDSGRNLGPTGSIDAGATDDAGATNDAGATDDTSATDAGATPDAPDAPPAYHGFVLAKVTQADATNAQASYAAFADFAEGPPAPQPTSGGEACSNTGSHFGAGGCCCQSGIATPWPGPPPDAAALTISVGAGAGASATLLPEMLIVDANSTSLKLHGTLDLGIAWSNSPGVYPVTDLPPWSPGQDLHVAAPGHQVAAFAATLRTGALLAGISPALDGAAVSGAAVSIDRARDFVISWTPDAGVTGATVVLTLRQVAISAVACSCVASDAAGTMTVDAALLQHFAPGQPGGSIQLARLTTTTLTNDNAAIDLVGAVARVGTATFP